MTIKKILSDKEAAGVKHKIRLSLRLLGLPVHNESLGANGYDVDSLFNWSYPSEDEIDGVIRNRAKFYKLINRFTYVGRGRQWL